MLRRKASGTKFAWLALAALALCGTAARTATAQGTTTDGARAEILSSEIELARSRAGIRLELERGREVEFSIHDGYAWVNGRRLGAAPRGEALDRAWRKLLEQGIDTPTEGLATLLASWSAPSGGAGEALVREIHSVLGDEASASLLPPPPPAPPAPPGLSAGGDEGDLDTVATLKRRIAELEQRLNERPRRRGVTVTVDTDSNRNAWYSPLRHIGRGIAGIISTLAIYAVLVGLGFAAVFFGRKPLERIADTARHETIRAGVVGLAGTFMVLPAFLMGILALAISIVGIPLLLVWVPLFPVAVSLAALLGYLAVGHAAGESLAERRFYGGEWFKRANSYYYVLTGTGVLLALFFVEQVVTMAGPWFGFIRGLLTFLAVVLTWIAVTVGFGAVLLTRGGTKPRPGAAARTTAPDFDVEDLFEEESHV